MIRDELTQSAVELRLQLAQAWDVIARKDRLIEALRAQVSALETLEVFGRLLKLADELDAQDKAGTPY